MTLPKGVAFGREDELRMAVRLRGRLDAVRSQTGITGLETAIVLIAFVVVASVFAFAVLTTGLISSEKSKEAIIGSLEETGSTLVLRGSMVAVATTTLAYVSNIKFQVGTASRTSDGVDFSDNQIVITYIDQNQGSTSRARTGPRPSCSALRRSSTRTNALSSTST